MVYLAQLGLPMLLCAGIIGIFALLDYRSLRRYGRSWRRRKW
jgi:hypothetical protein